MENIELENFDPEMLFPISKEKLEFRKRIINESIFSLGINENESILHFGIGSKHSNFIEYCYNKKNEYLGIDINSELPLFQKYKNIKTEITTIQSKIDQLIEESKKFDWVVITGILDNKIYEKEQYEFFDSIIRNSLEISAVGIVLVFNTKKTINDDDYNVEYISAYINAMFNRFIVNRLNEETYIFCIYNKYC